VDCPVIVITAHGSVKIAVETMREGAYDFLVKPFTQERLLVTLGNALRHQALVSEVAGYRKAFDQDEFCGLIGGSLAMQAVYRTIESAAASNATIFITGESGTGKELCAEAIHTLSDRRQGSFIPVNCASIPRDLIESELFGHVKGAFTGAVANRKGAAARAQGGTLFLDEICEMRLELQPKLLRFVQTGAIQRVGSDAMEASDARIVCASNRDPLAEVAAGRLREDLFYRLHVIPIDMPPLRQRGDDIAMVARRALALCAAEEDKNFEDFSTDARAAFHLGVDPSTIYRQRRAWTK
ncbi:MAG: sigma-54-dependent transcriptional regulator, partial [Alphaproteobacteria bacterium]